MTTPRIPTYEDLLWPTMEVLKKNGGSASIQELSEQVTRLLDLTDEISDVPHKDGPQTEVDYRLAWSRTHLKWVEAIENTTRGVWSLTRSGREISSEGALRDLVRKERRRRQVSPGGSVTDQGPPDNDWQEDLLAILRNLSPDAFERLCQRILRESGFTKVEVTGRSGDGGIDGAGVLRVNLISFHVRFQCKRYTGSVRASDIRDFRGAMIGRADKGLFLTTGGFTRDAVREAIRDGAPAIDLIDGIALCGLLKQLELGVVTATRPQPEFFNEL